jgi:hypothetical protein
LVFSFGQRSALLPYSYGHSNLSNFSQAKGSTNTPSKVSQPSSDLKIALSNVVPLLAIESIIKNLLFNLIVLNVN